MTHLVINLIDKLDMCGPMHVHWMYPIERAMKYLKGYIWNMSKLEGSIIEGYIFYETLGLCTEYMQGFGATSRHVWDANKEEGVYGEVLQGTPNPHTLSM
jgi:hypothetical protein